MNKLLVIIFMFFGFATFAQTPQIQPLLPQSGFAIDARYGKTSGGVTVPFASIAEANSLIPFAKRHRNLTCVIESGTPNVAYDYWYQGGKADGNLVLKFVSVDSTTYLTTYAASQTYLTSISTLDATKLTGTINPARIADGSLNIATKSNATGTPSSSTFLRGDNSWAVPSGSGTGITSIGITMPSAFNVSPATITANGAFTITMPGNSSTQYTNGAGGLSLVANLPISTATQTALNLKQDALVSATNIKTINGVSLLGSGNIVTPTGSGGLDSNWNGVLLNYQNIPDVPGATIVRSSGDTRYVLRSEYQNVLDRLDSLEAGKGPPPTDTTGGGDTTGTGGGGGGGTITGGGSIAGVGGMVMKVMADSAMRKTGSTINAIPNLARTQDSLHQYGSENLPTFFAASSGDPAHIKFGSASVMWMDSIVFGAGIKSFTTYFILKPEVVANADLISWGAVAPTFTQGSFVIMSPYPGSDIDLNASFSGEVGVSAANLNLNTADPLANKWGMMRVDVNVNSSGGAEVNWSWNGGQVINGRTGTQTVLTTTNNLTASVLASAPFYFGSRIQGGVNNTGLASQNRIAVVGVWPYILNGSQTTSVETYFSTHFGSSVYSNSGF